MITSAQTHKPDTDTTVTTQRDVDHATAASASGEVLLSGNTTSPPLGSAAESVSHHASGIQMSTVLPQLWSAVTQVSVFDFGYGFMQLRPYCMRVKALLTRYACVCVNVELLRQGLTLFQW